MMNSQRQGGLTSNTTTTKYSSPGNTVLEQLVKALKREGNKWNYLKETKGVIQCKG